MYSRPRQRNTRWLWIAIIVLVLGTLALAALRGWLPALSGGSAAKATPTPAPAASTSSSTFSGSAFTPGWSATWYRSPFRATTKQPADPLAQETFAEPGVLLDATAAYDHLMDERTPILIPEGGYAYVAVGSLEVQGAIFPAQPRNIYLVIFRGLASDGDPATDLNQVLVVAGYKPATGIYSPMPFGAYVSMNWFDQQIDNALNGSPNCGAQGCQQVTVVVIDLLTNSFRSWVTNAGNRAWVRVP